jgi:transcriptional regulator with XRE-family HTH domain
MGRHRDPAFEQMSQAERRAYEDARRARDRRRRPRQVAWRRRPIAADDDSPGPERRSRLRHQISAAIRSGRAERGLSQRELAAATGISQSALSRLESAVDEPSLASVVHALAAVGARLVVVTESPAPSRRTGEHARDRAGRRLPAHLAPYRLAEAHSWWPGVTDARIWHDEPRWSYRRRPP